MLLPIFNLAGIRKKRKMHNEIPVKPRRKKLDVQVHHQPEKTSERDDSERRIFGANHPKKIKHRKSIEIDNGLKCDGNNEEDCGAGDGKIGGKFSKRHLVKENEKLAIENNDLQERLMSMDLYINKKNNKFKEKLNILQALNEEVTQENAILKNQYQELMAQFRACQNELEVCRNCGKCQEYNETIAVQKNELLSLRNSNKELNEDLGMLKNVVYRLNVQLERYQQKLHKSNLNFSNRDARQTKVTKSPENTAQILVDTSNILSESHRGHPHTPISWGGVNIHTLGPLLDAYQETIAEKEAIIHEYEQQLATFTETMRVVTRENESLHKLLNDDEDCSKVLSVELDGVKKELQVTKEQNDLFIKKCALKQDKLDEVTKCYEQKVEQLKRDYRVLHEEYCKSRTEIAAIREKNKSLLQTQDAFKNERQEYIPISVHTASVNECKKWYEELKHQYEQEKAKLRENVNQLNLQLMEITEKIAVVNREKADSEAKVKAAEKQIKKIETKYLDLQHTLNEVQLSRSACRKQLHKAMNFARDLVSEQEALLKALNRRQRESKAVHKLGSDIACRMDTLRGQLKTVQQEAFQELTTVEQRMNEQDSLINTLKKEHNEEVERLRQIIKAKEEKNLLFVENTSIPVPHYLLFRDKNVQK